MRRDRRTSVYHPNGPFRTTLGHLDSKLTHRNRKTPPPLHVSPSSENAFLRDPDVCQYTLKRDDTFEGLREIPKRDSTWWSVWSQKNWVSDF